MGRERKKDIERYTDRQTKTGKERQEINREREKQSDARKDRQTEK